MRERILRFIPVCGLVLAAAACTAAPKESRSETALPNPASENCIKLGGRLETRQENGGEAGYCHLPDGRVVEEWALFRETTDKKSPQ